MTETPTVVIRFKDVEHDEHIKEDIESRARHLAEEFPEMTRFEITLQPDGVGFAIHGHVNGKNTEVASTGQGDDLRSASDQLFRRVKQQLRRTHDKRIFLRRREAQKSNPKH